MYRILIVDDEIYIADWIATLLEQERGDMLDVYHAYSASEAISWLNRAKIDIVLSDICMPDMDGTELAAHVAANWPYCKVLLLTAYANFDYAHKAIGNNVISYILKTESDDCILGEIDKAVQLIKAERANRELIEKASALANDVNLRIADNLVLDYLNGSIRAETAVISQLNELGMDFQRSNHAVMFIGKFEDRQKDNAYIQCFLRIQGLKKIVQDYLGDGFLFVCGQYENGRVFCILQANTASNFSQFRNAENVSGVWFYVWQMLEVIQEVCNKSLDCGVSFVLFHTTVKFKSLPEQFAKLNKLLDKYQATPKGFLVTDTAHLNQSNAQEDFAIQVIRSLQTYILEHLCDDISLVKLSEISGYNASYLSRFFKEHTGETISSFISRNKMLLVEKLMGDERLNIAQVAEKSGFESRIYFNQFIKRITGLTPQAYRKKIAGLNS